MSFRWDDLRVFLALYRTRDLERAAAQLDLQPSQAERRIAALEDDLGTKLFRFSGPTTEPTQAADELRAAAERAEAALVEVEQNLAGRDATPGATVVRIGVADDVAAHLLAPALVGANASVPDVAIELLIGRDLGDPVRDATVDLGVQTGHPHRTDVHAERVISSRFVIAGTVRYLEGRNTDDVASLDWLTYCEDRCDSPESRWFDRHIGIVPRLRGDSFSALVQATLSGCGVMLLPARLLGGHPDLVSVSTDLPLDVWAHLWLVSPKHDPGPKVGAVHRYLRERARDGGE